MVIDRLTSTELVDLQLREHLALDAIAGHCGQRIDVHALQVSIAVASDLAATGYGADEAAGLAAAAAALQTAQECPPGRMGGLSPQALQALRWFIVYHDAQRYAVTRREYIRAVARVRAQSGTCRVPRVS